MTTDEIYSEELEIASVHEPFRTALLGALKDRERTRKLLYSPPFSTLGFTAPASLLPITDERWLVILEEENEPYVAHATFDDTFSSRCLSSLDLSSALFVHFSEVIAFFLNDRRLENLRVMESACLGMNAS